MRDIIDGLGEDSGIGAGIIHLTILLRNILKLFLQRPFLWFIFLSVPVSTALPIVGLSFT